MRHRDERTYLRRRAHLTPDLHATPILKLSAKLKKQSRQEVVNNLILSHDDRSQTRQSDLSLAQNLAERPGQDNGGASGRQTANSSRMNAAAMYRTI